MIGHTSSYITCWELVTNISILHICLCLGLLEVLEDLWYLWCLEVCESVKLGISVLTGNSRNTGIQTFSLLMKPSKKAHDNAVIQKARLWHAHMGNIVGGAPSAISNSNASPGSPPFTTIFLGPQPQNDPSILADSSSALTLSTSNAVVATPWDPATCNVSQIVPTTHVIPPTPPPGENAIGHTSSSGINRAASEPSTPTSGRRMTIVNATLSAGYNELEAILITLVKWTNLPMQQILDGWHKSCSCTVSGINHWNQYTKYAMRHEEQEQQWLNLPPEVLHRFPMCNPLFSYWCIPVSPSVRHELYVKFKEDNPNTWQEILEVHDMVDNVQSSPQTIAQHAQTFNKIKKRIISVVSTTFLSHTKPNHAS